MKSDMKPGYIIVGALWMACAGGLLAAGATPNVAAAAVLGFIGAALLALPAALVAAGLWRATKAVRNRRSRRHGLRGGQ